MVCDTFGQHCNPTLIRVNLNQISIFLKKVLPGGGVKRPINKIPYLETIFQIFEKKSQIEELENNVPKFEVV